MRITIQNLDEAILFRCSGRLVFGHQDELLTAVSRHPYFRLLVLDLAEIHALDASGLGAIVSLQTWVTGKGASLKLMNLTPKTEALLKLLNLRAAFEICSVSQMLQLLCNAAEHARLEVETRESTGELPNTSWSPPKPHAPPLAPL